MLMKLRWVFNPVLIRKIIIILLAILIASITTSFSFGVRKAHGGEAETLLAQKDAARLAKLKTIISEITEFLKDKTVDKEVLKARLESYKAEDPSLVSDLDAAEAALVAGDKSALESFLRKVLPKRDELEKSARSASSTTGATC
ncbi:MAG: hypothetical protein HYY62_05650, partial [Deltaproteobacteria bacterium]|nr:hypothetical protein [Deltaproteobacteria bacterium]